MTWKLSDRYAL